MLTHTAAKHLSTAWLALLVLHLVPVTAYAIDKKFELDTKVFGKITAPPPPSLPTEVQKKERIASKKVRKTPARPGMYARGPKRVTKRPPPSVAGKMTFALSAPVPGGESVQGAWTTGPGERLMDDVKRLWPQLVPDPGSGWKDRFDYLSSTCSLSLDSERYPVLPAYDGRTILVDRMGTLPALVCSLIEDTNPQVSIVSQGAASSLTFYRSLLAAAQFYSLEEGFSVVLGSDPKVTMHADFRIEKEPESLLQQDVILVNVPGNRRETPKGLISALGRNGFTVLEGGVAGYRLPSGANDLLYQVTEKEPQRIVDSVLDALSLPVETGKSIDLYSGEQIGVRLDIPVDRYFEENGRRYVVSLFKGDPVSYTLTRLLETKGYRIVMINDDDDFKSIAEKLLARLQIHGRYAEQELWPANNVGYGVRISGVMVNDSRSGGRLIRWLKSSPA